MKIFIAPVLILLLIAFMSCETGRLTQLQVESISNKSHGYVTIDFSYDLPEPLKSKYLSSSSRELYNWYLAIYVNNNLLFDSTFKAHEKYRFPVPVGPVEVKYILEADRNEDLREPVHLTNGGNYWFFSSDENNNKIKMNVESDKNYHLSIHNFGEEDWKVKLLNTHLIITIPMVFNYQRVKLVPQ